jgi:hypothetical protein
LVWNFVAGTKNKILHRQVPMTSLVLYKPLTWPFL